MIEHQHAHWSRLSATPHAVRREAERRCQGMPMARQHRDRSYTAASLASIGWVIAYAGRDPWVAFVALGMTVIAAILFRMSRRPL